MCTLLLGDEPAMNFHPFSGAFLASVERTPENLSTSRLLGVRYTIRKYTHPHGYGGCTVAGAGYPACRRRNRGFKRLALRMDQEPGADASGRTRLRSSVRNCSGWVNAAKCPASLMSASPLVGVSTSAKYSSAKAVRVTTSVAP